MQIYWRIDVRQGSTWKTLADGTGDSEEYGYGWDAVTEHVFMDSGVHRLPGFLYVNTRVCIWPADLKPQNRSLDTLTFVRYHAATDARDLEDSVWAMCRQLKEWGALTDFGYDPDPTGDVFYIGIAGRGANEFHTLDDVYTALSSLSDGWLAARAQQPDAKLHPAEAEDIERHRRSEKYNDDLERIRAAGGELAARLETALHENQEQMRAVRESEPRDQAAIQRLHTEFQETVFALAAELDARSN